MKILILGGRGMLGHRLWSSLSQNHQVWATLRNSANTLASIPHINKSNIVENIDVFNHDLLEQTIASIKPDVVINCIGIIKQIKDSKDHITSIHTNALLPHLIAKICTQHSIRFIHFSTDCVFDGVKGFYSEEDTPNATDLYGKTKHLGEVDHIEGCLTLRTSIIGREIQSKGSLVDWFLSQDKDIQGYTNAIFSGFPTLTIANLLNDFILPNDKLHGLYHLSSNPINKYELLNKVKDVFNKDITINASHDFKIDRSLNSEKLRDVIGDFPREWNELISDLLIDASFYRSLNA
jgi:dTDP-4-dehydrorhamnose reductase